MAGKLNRYIEANVEQNGEQTGQQLTVRVTFIKQSLRNTDYISTISFMEFEYIFLEVTVRSYTEEL